MHSQPTRPTCYALGERRHERRTRSGLLGTRELRNDHKDYAGAGAIADRNAMEVSRTMLGRKATVAELVHLANALTLWKQGELRAALERLPMA